MEDKMCDLSSFNSIATISKEKNLYKLNKKNTIVSKFEFVANEFKNNIAVICGEKKISYGELNNRANFLAQHLIEKGVKTEEIVGVFIDRSLEMIISLLATLKVGAAYLPIDNNYPEERINYILKDSNISILLSKTNLKSNIDKLSLNNCETIINVDLFNESIHTIENIDLDIDEDNLAYVIYTSGTTGNPKGVLIEHKGILNYILWRNKNYNINDDDVILQLISFAFDGFCSNLYSALLSGATLVLSQNNEWMDQCFIKDVIVKHGVTNFSLVPSMYKTLLENSDDSDLKNIKFVVLAGEKTEKDLIKLSNQRNPEIILINEYGPTENSVASTAYIGMSYDDKVISIGKVLDNHEAYILDEKLNEVPVGEKGILYVAGIGLARGYLNRTDLTEEKFIIHNGKRLYNTGDFSAWLPDKNIQLFGRLDSQLKIRGNRIEKEEIENVLKNHSAIKQADIVPSEDFQGNTFLNCYLETKVVIDANKVECLDKLKQKSCRRKDIRYTINLKCKVEIRPGFFDDVETFDISKNGFSIETKNYKFYKIKKLVKVHFLFPDNKKLTLETKILGQSGYKISFKFKNKELELIFKNYIRNYKEGSPKIFFDTRRSNIRKKINVEGYISSKSKGRTKVDIINISSFGACICINKRFINGELLKIEIIFENEKSIIEAKVIWSGNKRIGLQFEKAFNSNNLFDEEYTSLYSLTAKDMRCYLANYLPDYMIPSKYYCVDVFPKTCNGKVDEAGLQKKGLMLTTGNEFKKSKNAIEVLFINLFRKFINNEIEISVKDNFIDIGGDSIQAIKILNVLNGVGVEIDFQCLFSENSIEKLSQIVKCNNLLEVENYNKNCSLELEEQKLVTYINYSISENELKYSWVELNCFYRSISIILKSFNNDFSYIFLYYSSLFYSFIPHLSYEKFLEKNMIEKFDEFYTKYLEDIFGASFNTIESNNEKDFHENIQKELFNGAGIIMTGDLFYLHYSNCYKAEHKVWAYVVKGFDTEKKLYYILSYAHVDNGSSTKYKDFSISFDDLYFHKKMYNQHLDKNQENLIFWSLQKKKEINSSFHDLNALFDLNLFYNDSKVSIKNIEKEMYQYYVKNRQKEVVKFDEEKLEDVNVALNFKSVFYDILHKMLSHFLPSADLTLLINLSNKLLKDWYSIRWEIINTELNLHNIETISFEKRLSDLLEIEKEYRSECSRLISSINVDIIKKEKTINSNKFIELNNDNNIFFRESEIDFFIYDDKSYNTWIFQDNAPQVLLKNNSTSFTFETDLDLEWDSENLFEPVHQSGIIIKEDNNKIRLFGLLGEEKLSLFMPTKSSPCLLEILFKENKKRIKIKCDNNKIQYFYYENKSLKFRKIFEEELDSNIKFFGLFSRTWNQNKYKFIFSNIKLNSKRI